MADRSKGAQKSNRQGVKPYPEFPLTAHPSGRWCKKHKGTQFYFGYWDRSDDGDWQAALAKYEREWPYILQGRPLPEDETDGSECTIADLCNKFLTTKLRAMQSTEDELSPRTFKDYQKITDSIVAEFGKNRRVDDLRPSDFEKFRTKLAKRLGTVSLRNHVNQVRMVFKYAHDQKLIPSPIDYGQSFNRPSAKALRKAKNTGGQRLFEADEIRLILDVLDGKTVEITTKKGEREEVQQRPDASLKAMVLLGANAGFGNTDIASLPQSAIDFENGWIDFPRPKTEVPRRVPVWPETVEALKVAIDARPKPKSPDDADLCFLTVNGNRWVRVQESKKEKGGSTPIDALSQKFARLLKRLNINGRTGLGFYTLRHNFQTIGGDAKDPDAVSAIMGHVDSSMSAAYRESVADERLRAVVDVVHAWLWPTS